MVFLSTARQTDQRIGAPTVHPSAAKESSPKLAAAAVAIAIMLAGCVSNEESPATDPPTEPSSLPDSPPGASNGTLPDEELPDEAQPWLIDWQECANHKITSYTTSGQRDESLPDGYAASGPHSDLSLQVITCDAVVVDNVTVIPGISAAFLITSVVVDASVEQEGTHEYYLFAVWSDNATLLQQYQEAGVQRSFVTTSFETSSTEAGLEIQIDVNGEPVIDVTGAAHSQQTTPTASASKDRMFYGNGNYTWVDGDLQFTDQSQPFTRPVAITYHPPWLQTIAAQPADTTAAEASQRGTSHIRHTLGALE